MTEKVLNTDQGAEIATAIQGGLAIVQQLSPLVGLLGGPSAALIANLAGAFGEVASNVLTNVSEGRADLASTDEAALQATLAELQAKNKLLGDEVAKTAG